MNSQILTTSLDVISSRSSVYDRNCVHQVNSLRLCHHSNNLAYQQADLV